MTKKIRSIYDNYKEIINYIIVGSITTFISLATFYICRFLIFSKDNQLHIQISNIVSWLVAVHFAFFANKKYVFESKEKGTNKLAELIKFDLSRVSTLIIEMICMWIMTSPLSINDKISKIVVQVIIMILNYVFSKLFVFNSKDGKKGIVAGFLENLKKPAYRINVIMFILITIIFYLAPYTHDDWAWGTQLGLDRLKSGFVDYNGRWVGNLVVLALTRSRILKAFVTSITLVIILKLMQKIIDDNNEKTKYIMILLLLLIPTGIFAQSLAWTSGFSNYVISFIFTLIFINLNKDIFVNKKPDISNKLILPMVIMGFIGALFLENLTIYNIVLAFFIIGYEFYKYRKVIISNIGFLVGSIGGAILMFSNSAYHNIANSTDGYRTIENNNIIVRCIKTYFETMHKYLFQNNLIINLTIGVLTLIIAYRLLKNKKNNLTKLKKYILSISLLTILTYLSYSLYVHLNGNVNLFGVTKYRNLFEGMIAAFYYLAVVATIFLTMKDDARKFRILFYIGSIIVLTGPLLIVTPIGPRNFFQNYILYIMIIGELISYLKLKDNDFIKKILVTSSLLGITYFLAIFAYIYKVELNRTKIIKSAKNTNEVLYLPKLPHENYMQIPNPTVEVFEERFKNFYHIDKNQKIKFGKKGKKK